VDPVVAELILVPVVTQDLPVALRERSLLLQVMS
jgi:hypothetical protein